MISEYKVAKRVRACTQTRIDKRVRAHKHPDAQMATPVHINKHIWSAQNVLRSHSHSVPYNIQLSRFAANIVHLNRQIEVRKFAVKMNNYWSKICIFFSHNFRKKKTISKRIFRHFSS